eukprot:CAMPEP_0194357310 /NCGR_PEP_ID=MMETSP0174-20130528/4808_1 /TAXON_ID=216777 /ORGANISM="Proboscia alata, Strain PI-D3" /LENGTH=228 /DNA_ID=CAMNT_0039127269 /DNA_START=13 /DNA_END=699 /DNA_ORIENTATION=+
MSSTVQEESKSSPPCSLIDILLLLEQYSESHRKANAELKSSFWNLTKARRQKGASHLGGSSVGLSASDVREELRARALLSIVKFDATDNDNSVKLKSEILEDKECHDTFDLHLDGMDSKILNGDVAPTQQNELCQDDKIDKETGIRQRRNKDKSYDEDLKKGDWVTENYFDDADVEDELLKNANPIDLFGAMPPVPLKVAQANAKDALRNYVDAANLVSAMTQIMNRE